MTQSALGNTVAERKLVQTNGGIRPVKRALQGGLRVGAEVASVRSCIRRGFTQEDPGERRHLHRTFIGSVERGERHLSILDLRLIARVLRVPLARWFAPRLSSDGEDRDSTTV